jgi:hypothetical protein
VFDPEEVFGTLVMPDPANIIPNDTVPEEV